MAYTLKIWTFNKRDGWVSSYDPLPKTLEDARSLSRWWAEHWPENDVETLEIQILHNGDCVESLICPEDTVEALLSKGRREKHEETYYRDSSAV